MFDFFSDVSILNKKQNAQEKLHKIKENETTKNEKIKQ